MHIQQLSLNKMNTVLCKTCRMQNDQRSTKCEHCKNDLSDETLPLVENWENEFRFIEEAEMQGNVYEISDLDDSLCMIKAYETTEINQDIKHEPEIQIEPDTDLEIFTKAEPCHSEHTIVNLYKCSSCKMSFKREVALKAHVKNEHEKSTKDKSTSEKKFYKMLDEEKDENLYGSLSNGFWKCNECNLVFSVKFDFKMHKNQHDGKKIFQCDVCKAYLSSSNILKDHKKKLHNKFKTCDEKKFRCTFCGERFSLQISLSNHKKTHTEYIKQLQETADIKRVNGRLTYVCKKCGKISSNKSRHDEHIRVHTKERPFKCSLCGAEFTATSSLVLHMRLHSDERPFKCEICSETYRHKKNLVRHLLKHSGQRPFKCQYCDKTFSLNSTKQDHERLKHTGETPYQCEMCKQCFKTSFQLNAHRRIKHDIVTNSKPRVEILINKIRNDEEQNKETVEIKCID